MDYRRRYSNRAHCRRYHESVDRLSARLRGLRRALRRRLGRRTVPRTRLHRNRLAFRARQVGGVGVLYRFGPPGMPGAFSNRLFFSGQTALTLRSDADISTLVSPESDSSDRRIYRTWATGLGAGLSTPVGAAQAELSLRGDLVPHLSISLGNPF